jgi:hypothetical protein
MAQLGELENTFIEEYEGAKEQIEKQRYKNATILFSKALFALCDYLLFSKVQKLPKNHNERFRMLEEFFPNIYPIVDTIFTHYTDSYSKPILEETCKNIQDGIKKIITTHEVSEAIAKAVE